MCFIKIITVQIGNWFGLKTKYKLVPYSCVGAIHVSKEDVANFAWILTAIVIVLHVQT